jgi:hypothetical protein
MAAGTPGPSSLPRRRAWRALGPRRHDDLGQQRGLGAPRLSPREGHQVVDDGVSQPRVAFDLGEGWARGRRVLPRQIDVRRDDLQHVA